MSNLDRRREHRSFASIKTHPVGVVLYADKQKIKLEVVNYHHRGACLRTRLQQIGPLLDNAFLKFRIGEKEVEEPIKFRLVWESLQKDGCFGVEFSPESVFVLARAERFLSHRYNRPTLSCADPLDPNRIVYFSVLNLSKTGMLLATSLTNRHLLPGMEIRAALLEAPKIGKAEVDLFIENIRTSEDQQNILCGVSIKGSSQNYIGLMSEYVSNLGSTATDSDRLEKLQEANLLKKELSQHLTIKEVTTAEQYEQVLKLRFEGYKLEGKIESSITANEMGPGLANEGVVLAAYLAGQMVASCEFRFQKIHGLNLAEKFDLKNIPGIRWGNLSEVNKLVVHNKVRRTDVVLGMFQKIHSLAMLNGRPDGIISAEDKLIPLYERLGFKRLEFSYPHPVKANTKLNLMVIYSESYTNSDGMNAYAWSVAFEKTRDFLHEIGLQKERDLPLGKKIQKFVSKKYIQLSNKNASKANSSQEGQSEIDNTSSAKANIDPRWTKQHINATVILPYLAEAEALAGREWVIKFLAEFAFQAEYFDSTSNWVSVEFFNELIIAFAKVGDPMVLNKNAAYRATSREVLKSNYFVIRHLFSPAQTFKAFEKFLPKFNKTRIFQVLDSGVNFVRIKISNPDPHLLPRHPSVAENWKSLLDAYVRTATGHPAEVQVLRSSFTGDEFCEYIVKWRMPLLTFRGLVGIFGLLGLAGFGFSHLPPWFLMQEILGAAAILLGSSALVYGAYRLRWHQKRYKELFASFAQFEKEADERYQELQTGKAILEKSYQEGKIIETISREIQNSDDTTGILETALKSTCEKFAFKRAFVMIADRDEKILRTTSIYGAENQDVQDLWTFKVDVRQKRENPILLSSIYFSGQSVIISNIEDHLFQLNDTSRALIKKLGSRGFVMVPIPSSEESWGVIVADKGQSTEEITRRDLVALQRVSQSLGIALDKKAKIEKEQKIRKVFEKYVPSSVVGETLGQSEVKLGGESKEVVCMFMDIREFTKISANLGPVILIDLLNRIFTSITQVVNEHGGTVDKFLGDGALMTWGAVPGSVADVTAAKQCAVKILEAIDQVNTENRIYGLPQIRVGLGLHKGPVIAGNIGSQLKVEYTVIGPAVNIASRLEQLCKVLNTSIVGSLEVFPEGAQDGWRLHKSVSIRGIEGTMSVVSREERKISSQNTSEGVS